MTSLFNILSILYILRGAQLLMTIWREWAQIVQEPLTRRKKQLAEQASFFLAVPIGVFFHELGHALTVWLFGGRVLGFNYRFFWGEVEHIGNYTPAERWIISLSGTIGSLLFGLGIWLLLRHNRISSLRYFGLRAFRFQIYFSLLYYPIFTIIFPIGDWRIIYDFSATPILSGAALIIHVIFLVLYWRYDKKGSFEAPATESAAEQARFEELERQVERNPHDARTQLQYVDMLRRGGAAHRAKTQLTYFLEENPHSAEGYLELAAIEADSRHQVSQKASQYAAKALQSGLHNPYQIAAAQQMVAKYALETGRGDEAVRAYGQAITAVQNNNRVTTASTTHQLALLADLYRARGIAYRRLGQYEPAYADLTQAVSLAQQAGLADVAAACQEELAILETHAGRRLNMP